MSVFKSVADLFRPVQQVNVSNLPAPAAAPAVTPPPPEPTPLDQIGELFKIDPKEQAPANPFAAPLLNNDPAKIAEAAKKVNLVGSIPPELLTKAMSGQDPEAFLQVLNMTAQQTLATSAQLSTASIEHAAAANNQRIEQVLPDRIKKIQLEGMVSDNPALQHPASQPFLQLVRSQIQLKEPGLSAQEINNRAEAALTGFASQLATPASQGDGSSNRAQDTKGTDWDSWAGVSS